MSTKVSAIVTANVRTRPLFFICSSGASAPVIVITHEMREAGACVIEELKNVISASALAEVVYIATARLPTS